MPLFYLRFSNQNDLPLLLEKNNQNELNLNLLATRDAKEIQRMIQLFSGRVYNLSLGYVRSKEDAEEITQDVFIAVLNNLEKFKGNSQLSTWIYRIATNKCLDFLKYKKRKKRFGRVISIFGNKDEEEVFEPVDHWHPGLELESKEDVNSLYRAIDSLPEKQKTALVLSKFEKLSQKEIAKILELTPKAVESLIGRAKANLRKALKSDDSIDIRNFMFMF